MSAGQKLVYIVDDSADYRFLVGQVFKRFLTQYATHFFESGTALAEQLQSAPANMPCLIVMDGHMPGLSGVETLTLLKQTPHWQEVPTVIVSSSLLPADKQQACAAGANDYIVKPTDLMSLKEELNALCQRWSAVNCAPGTR